MMHFVGLNGKTVILWTWILLAAFLFCIFNLLGFFWLLYFFKVRSPCCIVGQVTVRSDHFAFISSLKRTTKKESVLGACACMFV